MKQDLLLDIYTKHGADMIRSLTKFVKNAEEAEDCLQDAIMNCLKSSEEEPQYPRAYLYRAAINVAQQRANSRKREHIKLEMFWTEMLVTGVTAESPEYLLAQEEICHQMEKQIQISLGNLSPRQRQAVTLYYFEDQKAEDGAETMQITKNSFKSNRLFGLRRLALDPDLSLELLGAA